MQNSSQMKSGLRVISEHIPHVRTVTLGFWVRCGSFAEKEQEAGMSHFLEHMFFKGTKNRSARQLVEAFDDVGGELNAYTAKEYTCFYAKVIDEHMPFAVETLFDMLCSPAFAAADVEKEKQVVLEELAMYEDAPDELIHDYLATTIWPKHPLGRPILGRRDSIENMELSRMRGFYERNYLPKNIVVAAAGNLEHQQLVDLIEKHARFASPEHPPEDNNADISYTERVNIVERSTEQLHMCIGFPGIPLLSKDIYALNVLNNIFGGGMSSRLFQAVREDKGLAYNIYSYSNCFVPAGYYSIYAGLSPGNLTVALSTIAKEISSIKDKLVTPAELNRAKQQVKGAMVIGLESTANRMSRMGRGLLLMNKVNDIDDIVARIEAVTAEDVHTLAAKILQPEHASLCLLGQVPKDLNVAQSFNTQF